MDQGQGAADPEPAHKPSLGSDDPHALAAGVRQGDVWATSRLITLAELEDPRARSALRLLQPHIGRAHVVGVTGVPGGGKSTLVGHLITAARAAGLRVGVLAVDPSSPFTRGAILADRLRMRPESADGPGTFIRSLSSRGDLGGLSAVAWDAARIMDASGRDVIFIETVGAGQGEVDIAAGANTVVVVTVPGLGDSIQAMKAGLMEIADIFVVNKADRPGARETARALRGGLSLPHDNPSAWKVPIINTEALNGRGVEKLWKTIRSHRERLQETGMMKDRLRDQARAELFKRLEHRWRGHLRERLEDDRLTGLAEQIASGGLTVADAADLLWEELLPSE
jgi:LAO/AO transport system kinase